VFPWIALALALRVGSFLNVVIHRLPRMMEREWLANVPEILEEARELPDREQAHRIAGEVRTASAQLAATPLGLVRPGSHCPACGRGVRPWENIPLASWLALRRRCAGCGARISLRYPVVELLGGLGATWAAAHFGFGLAALGAMVFIWATIALAFIDQATGYLPDDITLPLLWSGPLVILASSVVGLVSGLAQMVAARRGWDGGFRFHFGPYLALAGIIAMFWGQPIVRWYLGH
jgi:leader peptidase (prepilin peptidase)/N-methyltransferase